MAPRISLQIVAVERRHGLQQASLRIGVVSNVCSLIEHERDRSREVYISTSSSPSNLFYNSTTYLREAEQAFGLRHLISSSL
jgi:hypothetical protein